MPMTSLSLPPAEVSAFDKRVNCDECLEITQEEFVSVSESTRGRVKLADVNHVSTCGVHCTRARHGC